MVRDPHKAEFKMKCRTTVVVTGNHQTLLSEAPAPDSRRRHLVLLSKCKFVASAEDVCEENSIYLADRRCDDADFMAKVRSSFLRFLLDSVGKTVANHNFEFDNWITKQVLLDTTRYLDAQHPILTMFWKVYEVADCNSYFTYTAIKSKLESLLPSAQNLSFLEDLKAHPLLMRSYKLVTNDKGSFDMFFNLRTRLSSH